jgi:ABC-type glutathione transport system ATPase component
METKKIEMKDEEHYYQYASDLLKDSGVKAKIIKYYLPFMNKYINKFLTSMDFFVQFILDEDFNETIKSRHRDEMSYMNFSEGEKMRIDLALLLAWREIARAKNSDNCNLLILDEVFDSSLDTLGMEELMKLLNSVSDKSNIYVISHKSDQLADKFQNTISFEKKNNFSRML